MPQESIYNNILLLSRNKLFYTKFHLKDTFQNRINLIFIHISFLLNKSKINNTKEFKLFCQKLFDLVFKNIEIDMREIGYSDTSVNKNMKFITKSFYDILFKCENYSNMSNTQKKLFLSKFLSLQNTNKSFDNSDLMKYFENIILFVLI